MGDDEEGRAFPIVGDGNSGKKKKVEPDGSQGTVRFIRITGRATGLIDLILVRTFSGLNDRTGLEP